MQKLIVAIRQDFLAGKDAPEVFSNNTRVLRSTCHREQKEVVLIGRLEVDDAQRGWAILPFAERTLKGGRNE
jgi:hypothetical protein